MVFSAVLEGGRRTDELPDVDDGDRVDDCMLSEMILLIHYPVQE